MRSEIGSERYAFTVMGKNIYILPGLGFVCLFVCWSQISQMWHDCKAKAYDLNHFDTNQTIQ